MTSQQTQTNLLPQHSEKSFRRYEQYIKAAVDAYPSPVTIEVKGLSIVTFSARLRDAKNSLLKYQWTSSVNLDKFNAVASNLHVYIKDGRVYVGPTYKTDLSPALSSIVDTFGMPTVDPVLSLPTVPEQDVVCLLAHHRLLVRAVRVTGLTPENIDHLNSCYDVKIMSNPDGTHTIL